MRIQSLQLCAGLLLLAGCSEAGNFADNIGAANSGAPAVDEPAARKRPGKGSPAAEAPADVTLSAAPAETAQGATITLTLSNGSDAQVGYNLCSSVLQTSAGTPVPTANVCTMELRTLKPGGTADFRYRLPVNMAEGGYRFVTQVERMQSGGRTAIASNIFAVR